HDGTSVERLQNRGRRLGQIVRRTYLQYHKIVLSKFSDSPFPVLSGIRGKDKRFLSNSTTNSGFPEHSFRLYFRVAASSASRVCRQYSSGDTPPSTKCRI